MRNLSLISLFVVAGIVAVSAAAASRRARIPDESIWKEADQILDDSIANGAFPGSVAIVADKSGILYHSAKGHFTYGLPPPLNGGQNPPVSMSTIYDMASCTKVLVTTSVIMNLYQNGYLPLESKVSSFIEGFGVNGKEEITVLNCLLHNAGFFPDPNPFWNEKSFDCPQSKNYYPKEDFSCMDQIFESYVNQSLQHPIGAQYVYSDLSYISLMFVAGQVIMENELVSPASLRESCSSRHASFPVLAQCHFEAFVREKMVKDLNLFDSGFLIPDEKKSRAAPTCNDTLGIMHTTIQGVVQDGNTYAMGGISGHAGFFSTGFDVLKIASRLMWASEDSSFVNKTTADLFLKEYNHTQSSRAIGWNTNDHSVFDEGFSECCGSLSPRTWMHTGYTGTLVCGDQDRELIVILLTNRVYPNPENTKIMASRKNFTSAVQRIYDLHVESSPYYSSYADDE